MKILEIITTALARQGVVGDMKNFRTEVEIPNSDPDRKPIKLVVTADNLQIRIEKE